MFKTLRIMNKFLSNNPESIFNFGVRLSFFSKNIYKISLQVFKKCKRFGYGYKKRNKRSGYLIGGFWKKPKVIYEEGRFVRVAIQK